MSTQPTGQFETATLVISVMAGSASFFLGPGRYDLMALIVALTIIFAVGSTILGQKRPIYRRISVSMVFAFLSLPVIGFFVDEFSKTICTEPDAYQKLQEVSCMPDLAHLIIWLLLIPISLLSKII